MLIALANLPAIGTKRTCVGALHMSAFDPERIFQSKTHPRCRNGLTILVENDPKKKPTCVRRATAGAAGKRLAPRGKRADLNKLAFNDPRTSEEVTANGYR